MHLHLERCNILSRFKLSTATESLITGVSLKLRWFTHRLLRACFGCGRYEVGTVSSGLTYRRPFGLAEPMAKFFMSAWQTRLHLHWSSVRISDLFHMRLTIANSSTASIHSALRFVAFARSIIIFDDIPARHLRPRYVFRWTVEIMRIDRRRFADTVHTAIGVSRR